MLKPYLHHCIYKFNYDVTVATQWQHLDSSITTPWQYYNVVTIAIRVQHVDGVTLTAPLQHVNVITIATTLRHADGGTRLHYCNTLML